MIKYSNIKMPLEHTKDDIAAFIRKKLKLDTLTQLLSHMKTKTVY